MLTPLFTFFTPMFILLYLRSLAVIILEKHHNAYREELLMIFSHGMNQVKKINEVFRNSGEDDVLSQTSRDDLKSIMVDADKFLVHCAIDD